MSLSGVKSASKTLFQRLPLHDPHVENDALVRVDGRLKSLDISLEGMFSKK